MESKRVEEEYQELIEGNLWPLVYQRIGQRCQSYPYTCVEAKKTENKPLNRYRDVNPYDHSRIVIRKEEFVTDYINANLVKMERTNRQYILTQGPLVYTSGHFWLMVWEQNSPAIVMLNKIIEKSEIKCHWYWPHENGDGHKVVYPDVNMSITQISESDFSYYTVRLLKMTYHDTEDTREIWHFHYTTWPDFEVPQSPHAFLNFLERVRENQLLEGVGGQGPAIVHCSAGIGRSGTFCLVDSVLVLIEKEGQANVDIQDILLEMRRYRMGLIQTSEQLRFSYAAIVEGIKRLDPNYKPGEEEKATEPSEAIYAAVAEEEEAPPPPPPRGESLGRPPARPLPAIPASASMAEFGLYARRRARAVALAQQSAAVVPSLASLAAAAVPGAPPRVQPSTGRSSVPTLALLAATVVLAAPTDARPLTLQQQFDMINQPAPYDLDFDEPNVVPEAYMDTEESTIDGLSSSDDESIEEPTAADDSVFISTEESAVTDPLSDDQPGEEAPGDSTPASLDGLNSSNIELSTNVESDSDEPPTPPPRDAAPRDLPRDSPSPASSAYADDDIDDETTTETTESTENADTVESTVCSGDGDGVRRRRAEQLAERVALMKKRSREADRWHSFKRFRKQRNSKSKTRED